jgi:hypothetical protein
LQTNMGFIRKVAENAAKGTPTWDTRFEVERRRQRLVAEKLKQQQNRPDTTIEVKSTRKATPMPEHLRKKFGVDKRRMDGSSMQVVQAAPLEQNGTIGQAGLLEQNAPAMQAAPLEQNGTIMQELTNNE